jgi:hypothetical protein
MRPSHSPFRPERVKSGSKSSFVPKSPSDEARRISDSIDDQQYRINVDSLVVGEVILGLETMLTCSLSRMVKQDLSRPPGHSNAQRASGDEKYFAYFVLGIFGIFLFAFLPAVILPPEDLKEDKSAAEFVRTNREEYRRSHDLQDVGNSSIAPLPHSAAFDQSAVVSISAEPFSDCGELPMPISGVFLRKTETNHACLLTLMFLPLDSATSTYYDSV